MRTILLLLTLVTFAMYGTGAQTRAGVEERSLQSRSVIDLHIHAGPSSARSETYSLQDGETPDAAQTRSLLEEFDLHGVVRAVVGGPPEDVERSRRADPERIIGSVGFPCSNGVDPNLSQCFV